MNPFDYPIALATPRRVTSTSTWVGHLPFAMALVDATRPRTIVELGSFTGESYCAFCQAVQALELGTHCFAVDTWQGDKHAGFYGPWILEELRGHHDLFYAGFSTLIQRTFDEALHQFDDGSIDLLHIDGLHTYDAVRHDFETWRPKLSDRAVVLLHDVVVRRGDFGVWKLWAGLREEYPSFEFTHSCGLGILCTGSAAPAPVLALTRLETTQADRIRTGYARLAERWGATAGRQVGLLETALAKMSNLKPATVPLLVATGQILLSLSDAETARRQFTHAIMLDAHEPAAHAGMAIALLRLGSPEAALAAIRRAMALGSTHVEAYTALASWCAGHDRLAEGLDLVSRALEVQPDDGEALTVRARLLAAADRPDEASDSMSRAIQARPQDPALRSELAELKLQSGLPMDALEALGQAAQIEVGHGTALIRIGEILIELGHGAQAVTPLEAFVQQNPYDVRGIAALVGALNLAQRGAEAERWSNRLCELAEESGQQESYQLSAAS